MPQTGAAAPMVLITRPATAAQKTARRLAALGWRPLIWSTLEIATLAPPASLGPAQAVLATSANAFTGIAGAGIAGAGIVSDDRPALCVGAATADAARRAGFGDARSADGDAAALVALATRSLRPQDGPLLFLRGRTLAADLAAMLRAEGFIVQEHVAYESRVAGPPPDAVCAALACGAVRAVTAYSPRAAQAFADHAPRFAKGLRRCAAVAISDAASAPLRGLGFAQVVVAQRPDASAVCAALSALPGAPAVPEK